MWVMVHKQEANLYTKNMQMKSRVHVNYFVSASHIVNGKGLEGAVKPKALYAWFALYHESGRVKVTICQMLFSHYQSHRRCIISNGNNFCWMTWSDLRLTVKSITLWESHGHNFP